MARARASPLGEAFETTLKVIALLFGLELADGLFALGLDEYGIRPREMGGLRGVIFAPLLHGGLGHVVANASSLCILLPLFLVDRRQRPWSVLAFIWVLGVSIWTMSLFIRASRGSTCEHGVGHFEEVTLRLCHRANEFAEQADRVPFCPDRRFPGGHLRPFSG